MQAATKIQTVSATPVAAPVALHMNCSAHAWTFLRSIAMSTAIPWAANVCIP